MSTGPQTVASVDEAHASLQVIAREIAAELNEARAALEVFAEKPDDRGALHRFAAHVHLARGALRLAEVYGGSLLAEEMEHVARYVDVHAGDGKADNDCLEALMRAMEQLPSYVERVASGGRDVPLALLPLLNDLRAARGSALLSEGTLLLLNLRSDEPARPASVHAGDREIADLARRLRPRFQIALLGWIRGENVDGNLGQLADIASQFEIAASTQPLFQLWWVVGAVLEALRQEGLPGSVSVKRLLGHVDRELRRLQETGEQRYADQPPVELLNNLLFYVARARVAGPRVEGVRRSFRLDQLLAIEPQDESNETLSAPSVRLMKTVAAAIREDLTRVKDVLDIFVRKGAQQVEELVPQLEMLHKISDTLGVLGLGALRDRVQGEIDALKAIVDKRIAPDDTALLSIASALIAVEDSLDAQLVRLIVPEPRGAADQSGEPTDDEFRQVQDAVLRECIVNMARIKEAVTQALAAPTEAQGLDQVPALVRGITAGLLMLGKQRAVEVMEGVGRALGTIVRPGPGALAPARLDRLADAIVAVEYYMEMLQAGRADQWQMLSAAETALADSEPGAVPRVVPLRPARADEPVAAAPVSAPAPESAPTPGVEVPAPSASPATAAAAAVAPPTTVDREFVELFVEEARENIARLQTLFPQWERNPLDADALRDVRRAFHTLKGSGRMVGARRVGEFSWSIESLLNRVISQTLPRTPDIVETVRDAVSAMPQLVDEIERGGQAAVDVDAIMARADALSGREATGLPAAQTTPLAPPPAVVPPPAPVEPVPAAAAVEPVADAPVHAAEAPAEPSMDPVLREIYRKETAGHIAAVRDFIERCGRSVPPYHISEALYRACHTLAGIAKTAGARQGIKVAEPMEDYVRKLFDNGHGLPEEGLLLLRDTVRLLETVSEHVDENTGFFPEQGRLVSGWHALDRALDAELASLAEAAEQTLGEMWRPAATPVAEPPATVVSPVEEQTEPSLPELAASFEGLEPDTDHTLPHEALPDAGSTAERHAALEPTVMLEPTQLLESMRARDAWSSEPTQVLEVAAPTEPPAGYEPTQLLEALPEPVGTPASEVPVEPEPSSVESDVRVEEIVAEEFAAEEIVLESPPEDEPASESAELLEGVPEAGAPIDAATPVAPESSIEPAFEPMFEQAPPAEPPVAPTLVAPTPVIAPPSAPIAPVAGPADAEFDADIAAIFGEEATELLEQADVALSNWVRDRADTSQVTELKRLLHTLKGGARMAGIRAMGDLSHELESFLATVESGAVQAEAGAIEVLQASLDELQRMREAAATGQQIAPASSLLARIRAVAGGVAVPAAEPAIAPPSEPVVVESPSEVAPVPGEVQAEYELAPPEPEPALPIDEPLEPTARAVGGEVQAEYELAPPEPEPALPIDEPLEPTPAVGGDSLTQVVPVLPGREPVAPVERQELARVDADLLDELLNNAGEVSIFRSRVEQQMTSFEFNLAELDRTVTRLREQLRKLEIETETQILNKHQDDFGHRADFDPLELDRYSMIQQLSRALAESVSDVASIEGLLENLNRETQNLLQQQGRIVAELQNGLMKTRMVPFQRHVQRLTRLARQAANEVGKRVELVVEGGAGEIDRQVLERMLPPFEHMLRNSIVHGVETPAERVAAGKPEAGTITMRLQREGAEVVIVVEDDGAGLNVPAIRAKARQTGLLRPDQDLTDEQALQLILEPGFSTADRLTQQAGRGVGMDVVATEVKKLGGGLFIESTPGRGARFTIRLPFTLAITQALIVRVHDELFALPVATVEGVARLQRSEIERHLTEETPTFAYGGNTYRFQHLGSFVGTGPSTLPETDQALAVILVRAGEHSTALVTDELVGSREVVVKSVGPQVASIRGISGATILGDGRIVIILDVGALVRSEWRARPADATARPSRDDRIFALVVDDSITVRRVTQRLLERNGMRVLTAKDGVEALALLQEHVPDVILLDIEMPRMDGYEVAAHVRGDPRIAEVPIIMITSRVGDKHRARAIEIGVDDYLGKPYQESQLLDAIEPLVLARRRQQ